MRFLQKRMGSIVPQPVYEDRWYQEGAVEALFNSVQKKGCHPIAAIPTAGGKTPILCKLVDRILSENPKENILVLSHVKEILEQDYDAMREFFEWDDDADCLSDYSQIGVYSQGLKKKEVKKITVAGIQSVWRKPEIFKKFGVVIIDECHLITTEDDGMYRSFLGALQANYVGLTATPYRTGHGYIHKGEGALFNELAYDLTSFDNFNRLTDEGFLSPLFSMKTKLSMGEEKFKIVAGDFSQKDMSSKLDRDAITDAAIKEVLKFGKKYNRWLFFAIDIKHAENITRKLIEAGISAIAIHSKMEGDRDQILKDSKAGKYRAVVNVDILTTGYNDPKIDLIVLMRPTQSPIIHVQTIGRGLRVHEDKEHCLVLDFAGNCKRLGPVNDVLVKDPSEKKCGNGGPMVKDCPECGIQNHLSAKKCANCDFIFPVAEKIKQIADSEADVVRRAEVPKKAEKPFVEPRWFDVNEINFSVGVSKYSKPNSFLVKYGCGLTKFTEQVCIEHTGYARYLALFWIKNNWIDANSPEGLDSAGLLEAAKDGKIKIPSRIKVDTNGKYTRFIEKEF